VATIVYFGASLVGTLLQNDNVSRGAKVVASIIPQAAISQGSIVYANYECTGVGLTKDTADVVFNGYSFNTACGMMAVSFLVFTLLGLYLDKVIPSKYGSSRGVCFCISPKFYGCNRNQRRQRVNSEEAEQLLTASQIAEENFELHGIKPENYEAPPMVSQRLEASGDYLYIKGLRKEFGDFVAVQNLNVKMYDSQIFAMLGHNGAGKTTSISMLTGLISKTKGEAFAYDKDMFEEADEVREFLGVCPQYDVLFELLTPREHIEIFYDFKGGDPALKQQEVDSLIEDSGLMFDRNKLSYTLSGGNKRKVSVCMALCGGSKLVILDEPTSGMDLGARRNLWDMLKKHKRDKIVILTTHYMDEADVLGDRIGIMAKGKLMCLGTSLFLKNRFGAGYKITFVKMNKKAHPEITNLMTSFFRGVIKQNETPGEINYLIPKEQKDNFKAFFEKLDNNLAKFEIKSYGVSMTTLEEVFLNINEEISTSKEKIHSKRVHGRDSVDVSGSLSNKERL
jgi:ATP-binding cassette subfamily A (ABC1) protein 3